MYVMQKKKNDNTQNQHVILCMNSYSISNYIFDINPNNHNPACKSSYADMICD